MTARRKLPYPFAKAYHVLVEPHPQHTTIYYVTHANLQAISEIRRCYPPPWILHKLEAPDFQKKMAEQYESALELAESVSDDLDLSKLANQLPSSEDLLENADDAPIIRLINALFTQAIKRHASDIHIEVYETEIIVRFRIDGLLYEILTLQRLIAPLIISRIKVMAKLDIAEKRMPQDGRISLKIAEHTIDVRVSTLPATHGERIVLRILDKNAATLDLNLLGIPPKQLAVLRHMIHEPHGIILVTGPTGSGKSTTLYAMLTELNQTSCNILTIEDPVEYEIPGIGQSQVNTKVDMTFAKGLRAILRQDPDVVMVGEIRDLETAEIAIQASLTGHLVLSTLHTNTALGSLTRLRDMGVEAFLLSTSLIGLISQRLVRKLCKHCREPHTLTAEERTLMNLSPKADTSHVCAPRGCDKCSQSGYQGRVGIYEMIPIDEPLRRLIHRHEELHVIEASIRPTVPSIRDNGFTAVLNGETSISEILRVTT